MISTLLLNQKSVQVWSHQLETLEWMTERGLRRNHQQILLVLKTGGWVTELSWVQWHQNWAATLQLNKGRFNSRSTSNRGLLIVLNRSLTAFQSLQHPLLKRRQLGRGLVHRSPSTLLSGIHKPLSLVLRFKSHGLPTVLHQKLHTQHDGVRKSIQSSRTEFDERPEQPSDPSGVEPWGLTSCHKKVLETNKVWPLKSEDGRHSNPHAPRTKYEEQLRPEAQSKARPKTMTIHPQNIHKLDVNTIHSKPMQQSQVGFSDTRFIHN